jgi:catechol 2,3-dioxygenase-like lactoylglutathione lyase family enzyme
MAKLRVGEPWMSAPDYGRSLRGLTVNLLVADVAVAVTFQTRVLGASVRYQDVDFAVLHGYDAEWMLHADHTYQDHPMIGAVAGLEARGGGVELRLHGCDPDRAEAAARSHDYLVLDGAADKPHGLREVFIVDPDGYVWVPDLATGSDLA